jgi:hypothetical protein
MSTPTDPRNWQGSGNRSVANMFIDLGHGVAMNDEQFQDAMAERRAMHDLNKNDVVIGCPLCMVLPKSDVELAEQAVAEAQAELERAKEALAAAKKMSPSEPEPENR